MKRNTREVLDLLAGSDLSVETELGLQQFVGMWDLLSSQAAGGCVCGVRGGGAAEGFKIF